MNRDLVVGAMFSVEFSQYRSDDPHVCRRVPARLDGAGLVDYSLFELGGALTGDVFLWDNAGSYLAGGIVLAAAVYQLTPLKDVCMRHCRSPFVFLMKHWRPGRLGGCAWELSTAAGASAVAGR